MKSPAQMSPDWFADIDRRVAEKAAKRAQRRKELLEKDIAADVRIVAWVDILGFRQQLEAAKTEAEYRAVYRKMLYVHEQFDAPSASDEPEEQELINRTHGRTVLALSDGLVVTASANAEARESMTIYDLLMSFIGGLVMAQAQCAANGIFLRGGISIGPFYLDNNILLSPALIAAYKLETERASYPVIIVEQRHIARLRKLSGIKQYSEDVEPSQSYFLPFKSPAQRKGERFYHLDYVGFLADPDNYSFFRKRDHKAFQDRANFTNKERDLIFSVSLEKSAAHAATHHKKLLIEAYNATTSSRIRAKYRWLMAYHNRSMRGRSWFFDKAQIDLANFKP
ncbi:MAG: hypothetical protein QOE70_4749 [Chthoniobacter sp.]|jgi:hypothetical protein|nr:hypothetical protein [Chthoniobacter sp.]